MGKCNDEIKLLKHYGKFGFYMYIRNDLGAWGAARLLEQVR